MVTERAERGITVEVRAWEGERLRIYHREETRGPLTLERWGETA